jgi:hypothetical protein
MDLVLSLYIGIEVARQHPSGAPYSETVWLLFGLFVLPPTVTVTVSVSRQVVSLLYYVAFILDM